MDNLSRLHDLDQHPASRRRVDKVDAHVMCARPGRPISQTVSLRLEPGHQRLQLPLLDAKRQVMNPRRWTFTRLSRDPRPRSEISHLCRRQVRRHRSIPARSVDRSTRASSHGQQCVSGAHIGLHPSTSGHIP